MKNMEGVADLEDYLREKILIKKRQNVISFAFTDERFFWVESFGKPTPKFSEFVPEEERENIVSAGVIWTLDKTWWFKQTSVFALKTCIRWDIDIPFLSEVMQPFMYQPSRNG